MFDVSRRDCEVEGNRSVERRSGATLSEEEEDLGEEVSKIGWECCVWRFVWLEPTSGDGGAESNNARQEQSSIGIERTAEKRHNCGCGKKVWLCSVNMRGDDGAVESWALVGRIPQSHCRAPNETRACAATHHHPFPFHSFFDCISSEILP